MTGDVTLLLNRAGSDAQAAGEVYRVVHEDLQRIARARMRRERRDHTLQATALVSEAFIRLVGGASVDWNDRRHFFRIASEAMKRVLIDHARGRSSEKRGGGRVRLELAAGDAVVDLDPERLLALEDALRVLQSDDPRAAEIAHLRLFGGLELDSIADLLDVSPRTAIRDWTYARARLAELLHD